MFIAKDDDGAEDNRGLKLYIYMKQNILELNYEQLFRDSANITSISSQSLPGFHNSFNNTITYIRVCTSNYWLHKVFEEIWQGFRLNNTLFKQFPSRVFESKAFCMTNLENNFHNGIAY